MGDNFRTMLNLEVIKSDLHNDLIYLRGSIPGSKNTLVFLKNSIKTINKKTILEKNKTAIDQKPSKITSKVEDNKESTKREEIKKDKKK